MAHQIIFLRPIRYLVFLIFCCQKTSLKKGPTKNFLKVPKNETKQRKCKKRQQKPYPKTKNARYIQTDDTQTVSYNNDANIDNLTTVGYNSDAEIENLSDA